MHFTLIDQTLLALMDEFDWVFNSENVTVLGLILMMGLRGSVWVDIGIFG